MDDDAQELLRPLVYTSPLIMDRRERMLTATWQLIAERGVEKLAVRDICQRAGVSQGTFHNAFGTKENIVSLAVVEFASTVVGAHYVHSIDTLEGRLEKVVRLNTNILNNKRYISACMKIFWADPSSTKKVISDITETDHAI